MNPSVRMILKTIVALPLVLAGVAVAYRLAYWLRTSVGWAVPSPIVPGIAL